MNRNSMDLTNPLLQRNSSQTRSSLVNKNLLNSSLASNSLLKASSLTQNSLLNTTLINHHSALKRKNENSLSNSFLSDLSQQTKRLELSSDHDKEIYSQSASPDIGSAPSQSNVVLSKSFPSYNLSSFKFEEPEVGLNLKLMQEEGSGNIKSKDEQATEFELIKVELINSVSTSLMKSPNYKNNEDETRNKIFTSASSVAEFDPEFILKLALYTRRDLYIRSTANFLLAIAAYKDECRPFLKKYFCAAIQLPSDWMDVAELYLHLEDNRLTMHAIPAVLRRCMVDKFPEFDAYQLAKYNKNKKPKKNKKDQVKPDMETDFVDVPINEEEDTDRYKKSFTLKQLIRLMHISKPVNHVMSLLGKKYPNSYEEFIKCRLPGTFNEFKAGNRMKLPIPETWETKLSMLGNKNTVWEELINNGKLPYMAMLRNLRNIILAGVSLECHQKIFKKLTNPSAVAKSKQFPVSFLTAYQIVEDLQHKDKITAKLTAKIAASKDSASKKNDSTKDQWWIKSRVKKLEEKIKNCDYSLSVVKKYLKHIKDAVDISVNLNVPPIKGTTVILMSSYNNSDQASRLLKSLPEDMQKIHKAVAMLAAMCLAKCENGQLFIQDSRCDNYISRYEFSKSNILENVNHLIEVIEERLKGVVEASAKDHKDALETFLNDLSYTNSTELPKIDNIVFLSVLNSEQANVEFEIVQKFLQFYRQKFNPELVFMRLDASGSSLGLDKNFQSGNINDIYVSGFSDQILRLLAEKGNGGQLTCIENIDKKYNLISLPKFQTDEFTSIERCLPRAVIVPKWKTCRVFISSTFLDMQAERNLLVRHVFPELRNKAKARFVNVYEVDLRWGISEMELDSNRLIEICLDHLSKCDIFIGILGERYGNVPDVNELMQKKEFEWIQQYGIGCSATELEIKAAQLMHEDFTHRAFFYLRNPEFLNKVPQDYLDKFIENDPLKAEKLNKLKENIKRSGAETFDGYECKWGGVVDKVPVLTHLNEFGHRVIDNIYNFIEKNYPAEEINVNELEHEFLIHSKHAQNLIADIKVNEKTLGNLIEAMRSVSKKSGIVSIVGNHGSGKSSMMASLYSKLSTSSATFIYFVGLTPNSDNSAAMLRQLCHNIASYLNIEPEIPGSYSEIVLHLKELLNKLILKDHFAYVLIDGIDCLSTSFGGSELGWLNPLCNVKGIRFVCSMNSNSQSLDVLAPEIRIKLEISPLNLSDRNEIVNTYMANHCKVLDNNPFNNVMRALNTKQDASLPLYLNLACEQLMNFGVHSQIPKKIRDMGSTLSQLIKSILMDVEAEIGSDITKAALTLLILSKHGLERSELLELLNMFVLFKGKVIKFESVMQTDIEPGSGVKPILFENLLHLISVFFKDQSIYKLNNKYSSLIKFTHRNVKEMISNHYLGKKNDDFVIQMHTLLAGLYMKQFKESKMHDVPKYELAYSCLPIHLAFAGCYSELADVLTDFAFITIMVKNGLVSDLIEEFDAKVVPLKYSFERKRLNFLNDIKIIQFKEFLIRNKHHMRNMLLLFQIATSEPEDSYVHKEAMKKLEEFPASNSFFLKKMNFDTRQNKCISTINTPIDANCVEVMDSNLILVGFSNGAIQLYDSSTNRYLKSFIGHSNSVVKLQKIGRTKFCSASKDKTLCIWDVDLGIRLHTLSGHLQSVTGFSVDGNNMTITSIGLDCKIILWSVSDGSMISKIHNERYPLNCVEYFKSNQDIVVGGWDYDIKCYDLITMKRKYVLKGHNSSVQSLSIHKSENYIASSSMSELIIWSISGKFILYFMPMCVSNIVVAPVGGQILASHSDKAVVSIYNFNGQLFQQQELCKRNSEVVDMKFLNHYHLIAAYKDGYAVTYKYKLRSNSYEITKFSEGVIADSALTCLCVNTEFQFFGDAFGCVYMVDSCSKFNEIIFYCKIKCSTNRPVTCISSYENDIFIGTEDGILNYYEKEYDCSPSKDAHWRNNPQMCTKSLAAHDGNIIAIESQYQILLTSGSDKFVNAYKFENGDLELIKKIKFSSEVVSFTYWNEHLLAVPKEDTLKAFEIDPFQEHSKKSVKIPFSNVAYVNVQDRYIFVGCNSGKFHVMKHDGTVIEEFFVGQVHNQRILFDTSTSYDRNDDKKHWSNTELQPFLKFDKDFLVASVSNYGTISVYKRSQAELISSIGSHQEPISNIQLRPDETFITCSKDAVKIWSSENTLQNSNHSSNAISNVKLSNSRYAISYSEMQNNDYTARTIWDVEWFNEPRFIQCHRSLLMNSNNRMCISFLNNLGKIFIETNDFEMTIYSMKMKKVQKSISSDKDTITNSIDEIKRVNNEFLSYTINSCHHHQDLGEHILLSGLRGIVIAHKIGSNNFSKKKIFELEMNDNYPIDAITGVTIDKTLYVYAVDSHGYITLLSANKNCNSWDDEECSYHPFNTTSPVCIEGSVNQSPTSQKVYSIPSSIFCNSELLIVGDYSGYISIFKHFDLDFCHRSLVHNRKVVGCKMIDHYIFTASADGIIKVWYINNFSSDNVKLIQIAMFECSSAITSIDVLRTSECDIGIMAGDICGNIYFFNYKYSNMGTFTL